MTGGRGPPLQVISWVKTQEITALGLTQGQPQRLLGLTAAGVLLFVFVFCLSFTTIFPEDTDLSTTSYSLFFSSRGRELKN